MRRNPQDGVFRGPRIFGGLLVMALALGACESDSIVDGDGSGDGGEGPSVSVPANQVPSSAGSTDAIVIEVQAQDDPSGAGLQSIGAIVVADGTVTVGSATLSNEPQATRQFSFPVSSLPFDGASSIELQYYGWAVDAAGNCTLAGAGGATRRCTLDNGVPVIGDLPGQSGTLRLIDIRIFRGIAPGGEDIGDLVVDLARNRVYISNKADNAVEILDWDGAAFTRAAPVLVGALPWGMTIDRSGDTLIVANSGGTSLSYVSLDADVEARRYETPNAVLYQLTGDSTGVLVEHRDFSDRPQYVAQDNAGFTLYSTQPTTARPEGSIRWVESLPSWAQGESDLMLWTEVVLENAWGPGFDPLPCGDPADDGCVLAFVDSTRIIFESPFIGTQLIIYDHLPGSPGVLITDTVIGNNWDEVRVSMRARGSDVFLHQGMWDYDYWLTGDTTFVAASGDGSWIGIAEGATSPGRTWLWGELGARPPLNERFISQVENIDDYVGNTSDQITGLTLNHSGLVLASRSPEQVFFFTNPLRLRGMFTDPAIAGGSGIALHPDASFDTDAPDTNWAAVGGAGNVIVLVDTRHFRRVGSISVGEPVGSALRVTRPVAGDDAEVVGHIFGVTGSGSAFEIAVRSSDIES